MGFYFETTHQNVLKLLGWPCGVLNYRPAVKWAWNTRAFSFKLNPKSYVICLILETLVGFYFETPHQNVLKLLAWPHGVLNYNPEVKWAWNNRAFSFKLNPKSYVICLILECLVGFYFESKYHNGRTLPLIVFACIDCLFVCTRRMLVFETSSETLLP